MILCLPVAGIWFVQAHKPAQLPQQSCVVWVMGAYSEGIQQHLILLWAFLGVLCQWEQQPV